MKTAEEYEAQIADLTQKFKDVQKLIDDGMAEARARIRDVERSAASAREIARVAMTHTGTRAMRVYVENTNVGLSIIVCDPAGDEVATTMRMSKMLDASVWALVGVTFTDGPPQAVGSTE